MQRWPIQVYTSRSAVVGALGNVQLGVFRDRPTMDDVRAVGEAHRRLHVAHPEGTGVIAVIRNGAPLADRAVRKLSSELMRQNAHFTRGFATVIDGGGLWASMASGAMDTMFHIKGPPCPIRAFSNVGDATRWLSGVLGEDGVTKEALCQALRVLV